MVGAEGFEPSNTGSKGRRLTAWPRPNTPGQTLIVAEFTEICPTWRAAFPGPVRSHYFAVRHLFRQTPDPALIFAAAQGSRVQRQPSGPRQVVGRAPGRVGTLEQAENGRSRARHGGKRRPGIEQGLPNTRNRRVMPDDGSLEIVAKGG